MERYRNKIGFSPAYCKRGFTLIEILVSGTILIIAMALIAIFFVKTTKMRGAVTKENNTQVIASQMMNTALSGISQLSDGLMYAKEIKEIDTVNNPPKWITFASPSVPPASTDNYVRLEISAGTTPGDITFWQKTLPISGAVIPTNTTPGKDLDPNDKINLDGSGSYFTYYDVSGTITTTLSAISQVEIRLTVKDKNLPNSLPFVLKNTVTLKNIPHID